MAKKKVNTKVLTWLTGPFRKALGPEPNTLAPINIIAFFVPHAHSDAAMQILHWYTTLGMEGLNFLKAKLVNISAAWA